MDVLRTSDPYATCRAGAGGMHTYSGVGPLTGMRKEYPDTLSWEAESSSQPRENGSYLTEGVAKRNSEARLPLAS